MLSIVLYVEASLLAWLDNRTERGFEVASDQLAPGRGVLRALFLRVIVAVFVLCFCACSWLFS